MLYVTTPDNVWALDANDGHLLWHYFWKTKGGTHIGNRGVGMWGNYLFFVTPDNYLISLEAKTGKERWRKELASFQQQYFHTMAPDRRSTTTCSSDRATTSTCPAFLQSFDPETGELQWKWYATPQKAGDPGLETWKNLDAVDSRRRPSVGARRLRSRDAPLHHRHRQPDAGVYVGAARRRPRQPVSRARSSRSTSTPARWPGTTRRRRTTRTTGTRRRRRCSSTASSTAARARW